MDIDRIVNSENKVLDGDWQGKQMVIELLAEMLSNDCCVASIASAVTQSTCREAICVTVAKRVVLHASRHGVCAKL